MWNQLVKFLGFGDFVPFLPKKIGGHFPFFIKILASYNLLILNEIGKILSARRRLEFSSRNSWWQQKRVGSISEGICGCFFADLRGGVYFMAYFFVFFVVLFLCFILDIIFFCCDKLIPGCRWVEIEENCERFAASTKKKFL